MSKFHPSDENVSRDAYVKTLEVASYSDFSRNFLNIPGLDDEFYYDRFYKYLIKEFFKNKWFSWPLFLFFILSFWYLLSLGMHDFYIEKLKYIKSFF